MQNFTFHVYNGDILIFQLIVRIGIRNRPANTQLGAVYSQLGHCHGNVKH